jgi:hypothetical protein
MNPLIQLKKVIPVFLAALTCFGLSPMAHALLPPPPPDGGYPGANTAEGDGALFSLTDGIGNTAVGFDALNDNTTGNFNTATGSQALFNNTTGDDNTANGFNALVFNTTGVGNTATGADALFRNRTGSRNTANGLGALNSNTTGSSNTANGVTALELNTTGRFNTANGAIALLSNTTGNANTANGAQTLLNNTTGSSNIALGFAAGSALTTGSNNIDIDNDGVAAEANTIRIGTQGTQTATFMAGISGTVLGGGVAVRVNANGQLGTVGSSARFKQNIKPMDKASEAIHALKPVTFRYRDELDPEGIPQFGLVAEQVEKVNPDLVVRDKEGKFYTVRYDAVNAMLLNEFLKEHRKVEKQACTVQEQEAAIIRLKSTVAEQEAKIAQQQSTNADQQKAIEALTASVKEQAAQIQKVSDHVELSKTASQLVVNSQ